jgi:hypothetical protein
MLLFLLAETIRGITTRGRHLQLLSGRPGCRRAGLPSRECYDSLPATMPLPLDAGAGEATASRRIFAGPG